MFESRDMQSILSGGNAEFLDELFEQYLQAPEAFDSAWREFFDTLQNGSGNGTTPSFAPRATAVLAADDPTLSAQSKVFQLIDNYRAFGHLQAHLDPLGSPHIDSPPDLSLEYFGLGEAELGQKFFTGTLVANPMETLANIRAQLTQTYCGSIGVEYMSIPDQAQRRWLQEAMESTWNKPQFDKETRRLILSKLTEAELFEKFLHTKFVGQKRFSLEGAETLIVMMDALVEEGAELGLEEIVLGMPHRGRLNTLVNVMGKQHQTVFAEFFDSWHKDELSSSGDVKYHMGYSDDRQTRSGRSMHLSLTFNPSHLEAVNPVVEGNVRAKQDRRGDTQHHRIMAVLMHGDSAVVGQGLVAETFNLSQLAGYKTGGTIHIIVNNQIGFTTHPRFYKSSLYSSDICKLLNIPVLHVNGDDPEAAYHVARLAVAFRQKFHTDIVIDMMCYRRHGHNEMDEPAFTQPLTYKKIRAHPSTLTIYTGKLEEEGVFSAQEMEAIQSDHRKLMDDALDLVKKGGIESTTETLTGAWTGLERNTPEIIEITEVNKDILKEIATRMTSYPEDFTPHPRVAKLMQTRAQMGAGEVPIDWGMGELLAYACLVWEGFNVRLSGQDVTRGTFSHRHANLVDSTNGKDYLPIQHLKEGQGVFDCIDSPLSEAGVLGFEFGYSLADPYCLTIWEAQFGDFANSAQVIIDQFVTSSEEKWLRLSGLVMLLPHGFEGMGPEHSSARLERYLQACGRQNIQVCNATNPAQMFHLLRRQLHRNFRKPLIVMSPKSLLRNPMATSSIDDLIKGQFRKVLFEKEKLNPKGVKRVVFCSGKVYYDLVAEREKRKIKHVALIRLEQFYPFPDDEVSEVMAQYPGAKEVIWAQEEPQNMGGWTFIRPYFEDTLPRGMVPRYVGRIRAASPATGSHHQHDEEQQALVREALT